MIELSNGYSIPEICFGTDIVSGFYFDHNIITASMIKTAKKILGRDTNRQRKEHGIIKCANRAIDNNCFFFDTSRAYGCSEKMLKKALERYNRDQYYICTKLCNKHQLMGKSAKDCLKESMDQLGVDYVDLYLLHWPVENSYLQYWKQLEELYREGLVRAIGVSNCKVHHLNEIKEIADIMPMVDEVELHPLLSEVELRRYCSDNSIQVMAYTSTARMDFRLLASKRLRMVCESTGKNLSQVILRWHIQNGVIPIFNTSSLEHFIANMDVFSFSLDDDQMNIINSVNINARTRYDSDNCEWDML